MSIRRWDPFRDMMTLRDAMDRLFQESFVPSWGPRESARPLALDMYETEDHLVIEADLPGLNPEDVEISVQENTLTIKGEYKQEEEREEENMHLHERRYGRFQRSVALPTEINADAAEASFKDGVLMLRLPKAEEVKPKQIPVKKA
jgi:HSP20 family protein